MLDDEFDILDRLYAEDEDAKEAWGEDQDLRHVIVLFFFEHKHPLKFATEETFRRYVRLHNKVKRLSAIIPTFFDRQERTRNYYDAWSPDPAENSTVASSLSHLPSVICVGDQSNISEAGAELFNTKI